jgi:hypothetical protein
LTGGEKVKTFRVAPGTIQDGTNGEAVSISGLDTDIGISSTKFIVIEATIAEGTLAASGWSVTSVDSGGADEVRMTTTEPIYQDRLRLLVGKVVISGDEITASQAVHSNQRTVVGVFNGVACKFLASAPKAKGSL